jgi:phosphatidylglycerol lysyltransferase
MKDTVPSRKLTSDAPGTHNHWVGRLKKAVPFVILAVLISVASKEILNLDWPLLRQQIHSLPSFVLLGLLISGLAGVASMSAYDLLVSRWLDVQMPSKDLLKMSWVANTFNNFIGLSGMAGSGIRYVILTRSAVQLNTAMAYSAILLLSVPVGLAVLALVVLVHGGAVLSALPVSVTIGYLLLGLFAAYLVVFLLITGSGSLHRHFVNEFPALRLWQRLLLIVVSVADWLLAVLVLGFCFHAVKLQVDAIILLEVFALSATVGILSLLPGGLGAFDATLLLLLTGQGFGTEPVIAGLMLFRLSYHLVPWLIGVWLGASLLEIPEDNRFILIARRWQNIRLFSLLSLPFGLISRLGVFAFSWLTTLAGIVLLVSAASPALFERAALLKGAAPLSAIEGAHLLSVVAGILLLALARGIRSQVRSAYNLTMLILLGGALFSLVKGLDYEEAIMLLVIAGLLRRRKSSFFREGIPLFSRRNLIWLISLLLVLCGYLVIGLAIYKNVPYEHSLWLRFGFDLDAARFLRSSIVALVTFLGILGWSFFRLKRPPLQKPNDEDLTAAQDFLLQHGGNSFAHMLFMGDKHLFYSSDHQALIQFGQIGDRLVALGDPNGDAHSFKKAIHEFRKFADRYDLVPVFYEVMNTNLNLYHDLGFSLFKLGESARVDVTKFSLSGKKRGVLRTSVNKITRDGGRFELLEPPFDEKMWLELQLISNAWLKQKKVAEKSFSLGRFKREYLEKASIAVVRIGDEIVAFASMIPGYNNTESLSVDLMRHRSNAPPGVMDFLFVQLIDYTRKAGYRYFDLGVAPLSGVGDNPYARSTERVARLAYEYGNRFYNYKGLRSFKEKFHPIWCSMYLAYPISVRPARLLVDIAALIAGGYWQIIRPERDQEN